MHTFVAVLAAAIGLASGIAYHLHKTVERDLRETRGLVDNLQGAVVNHFQQHPNQES